MTPFREIGMFGVVTLNREYPTGMRHKDLSSSRG